MVLAQQLIILAFGSLGIYIQTSFAASVSDSNVRVLFDNNHDSRTLDVEDGMSHEARRKDISSYESDVLDYHLRAPIGINDTAHGRSAVSDLSLRWPGGVVPYEIKGKYSEDDMAMIRAAFEAFRVYTCIRFVPRSKEVDFISIENKNSQCESKIGRMGHKQIVNINPKRCLAKLGQPIHILMHALGFINEHSRDDRNNYVKFVVENIKIQNFPYFYNHDSSVSFGVPYDYGSVMHPPINKFSKNNNQTIVPLQFPESAKHIGQRNGFSPSDITKLNRMYCSNSKLKCRTGEVMRQ